MNNNSLKHISPGMILVCIKKDINWKRVNVGGQYIISDISFNNSGHYVEFIHNLGNSYPLSYFRPIKTYRKYKDLTWLDKIKRNEEKFYEN